MSRFSSFWGEKGLAKGQSDYILGEIRTIFSIQKALDHLMEDTPLRVQCSSELDIFVEVGHIVPNPINYHNP